MPALKRGHGLLANAADLDAARLPRARGWCWAFFCQGYSPDLVSGLLQTSEYAAAVLRLIVDFHGTPDDIEAGVAALRARAQYVGQEDRIFPILLGEQALNTHLSGLGEVGCVG
ncbi:Scr1 family TA system antitoxin-like transcriptional regulator [Streptomyces niveus]|uniref:Scr1 family TA system antitoxin-like transcriptional regulator n=1 Tax=Streptomyces niveus TaxID=193462 RepID=UPI003689C0D6